MKKEIDFKNVVIAFVVLSIFTSLFIAKVSIGLSLLLLLLSTMVYGFCFLTMISFFKNWRLKEIIFLGMPLPLLIFFAIALLVIFVVFSRYLGIEDEILKIEGLLLSFHFFLGISLSILNWYFGLNEIANKGS